MQQPNIFGLVVNLDERGYFDADLRSLDDRSLMNISNAHDVFDDDGDYQHTEYGDISLVEDGYMKHGRDIDGLCQYAIQMGIIPANSQVLCEAEFFARQREYEEAVRTSTDSEPVLRSLPGMTMR